MTSAADIAALRAAARGAIAAGVPADGWRAVAGEQLPLSPAYKVESATPFDTLLRAMRSDEAGEALVRYLAMVPPGVLLRLLEDYRCLDVD